MADLLVIVPSRGRPDNLRRVIQAWDETAAWEVANLLVARDADDPQADAYAASIVERPVQELVFQRWLPMVRKLDRVAVAAASGGRLAPRALAFMGDDHLPRTVGWARSYLDALGELGTGIVYGDDLVQGGKLPTQWAMTSDIVRALGRMVPAPVEHLYCDNSILALGRMAGCIRHLPEVVIEHMHPIARRAEWDAQYRRVNHPDQYARDGATYRAWVRDQLGQDAATVRKLREVAADGVAAGVRADR